MGTLKFVDAAFMPDPLPDADGFCFYIGGDTPHVYTHAEVAALKAKYRYLLPIFVRAPMPGSGAASDVVAAVTQLRAIGAPKGTLVAWDSETSIDAPYIQAVYADLAAAGWKLIDYGSQAFVFGNQNPDGYYWGADWTSIAHLHSGDAVTQYASFSGYDESLAESTLPFWDPSGPAPDPPSPVNTWQETMMNKLPTLQQGAQDTPGHVYFVTRIQALVEAIGAINSLGTVCQLTQDGDFGPGTTAGVTRIQQFFGLTQDGIVGPHTWSCLVTGAA